MSLAIYSPPKGSPFRSIRAFIHGIPKGQPRPRAFARNGKARVYDPATAESWKSAIACELREKFTEPFERRVRLNLVFILPRPKSHYRKNGELKPDQQLAHTNKPDLDNLAKAVLDACTTIGLWQDDALVWSLLVCKRYPGQGDRTGCFFTAEGY